MVMETVQQQVVVFLHAHGTDLLLALLPCDDPDDMALADYGGDLDQEDKAPHQP